MKPGDIIHKILHPFVKGTRYEDCEKCNRRRQKINNAWDKFIGFLKRK